MVGIPPSITNEWSQNQSNENVAMMLQTSTGRIMEKQSHAQQPQQPLKCPRCDSENTKFCYYNNYSLSQPRHFCKACKRYWTRGGTLRNVPVGGGCRKNKRVIRRPTSSMDGSSQSNPITSSAQTHMDFLFGFPSNPSDQVNLAYPRFNTSVPNMEIQPQFNALGLGFSSGTMSSLACESYIPNGFDSSRINQDLPTSKPLLSSSSSMFGNSHSPAMASFLASTLAPNNVQVLESQRASYTNIGIKDVKAEEQNSVHWNIPYQNQVEQFGTMSDPSMYWNGGSWHDPTNIGSSSVPSLI